VASTSADQLSIERKGAAMAPGQMQNSTWVSLLLLGAVNLGVWFASSNVFFIVWSFIFLVLALFVFGSALLQTHRRTEMSTRWR
jgi:hypothetical protein